MTVNLVCLAPPRLLLGVALLYWGAVTNHPLVGLIAAFLVEARAWIDWRWNFGERGFVRAWALSILLAVLFLAWTWLQGSSPILLFGLLVSHTACTAFELPAEPTDAGTQDATSDSSTDSGTDAGPTDSGPLTEGPCRLQNPDQILVELTPEGLDKLLFAPGGTSAIGMALKLARYASGRHKTLSMWDSFHGASLDAISIGGEALFRKDVGPLLPGTEHIPPPTRGKCLFNCSDEAHRGCLDYLDYVLGMQGDVAALIAEPMRWTTVELPPPGYWKAVREICDRHDVLLIFDEIPSALGRTGKLFVCEHFDVVPDMLVIGKGFGGGVFPMAALITRASLDVVGDRALGHYTHEKSSVGCAAALATLDCLLEDGLIEASAELGAYALERLEAMRGNYPIIHEVRGLGLHLGIELRRNGEAASDEADRVLYHSLANGLSYKVGGGNVLTLCPPMTITRDQLDRALDIVEAGIAALD